MKRSMVAALAAGSLVFGTGVAVAAGGESDSVTRTGGTVYVTQAQVTEVEAPDGAPSAQSCEVSAPGWCRSQTATGTVDIVAEDTAPDAAALRFTTVDETGAAAMTYAGVAGTPLSSVELLRYRTLIESAGSNPDHAPALSIELNDPGRGYVNLIWEPAARASGLVRADGWQAWEPTDGAGGWWSNKKDGAELVLAYGSTFEQVQATFPQAALLTISIKQGSSNAGLIALADLLTVNDTTYDFSTSSGRTTTTVPESALDCGQQWCRAEVATGTVTIEHDPFAPGLEALRFSTPEQSSRASVVTSGFEGRSLSSLGALEYSSALREPGTAEPRQQPALVMEASVATGTVTLIWEPLYPHNLEASEKDTWKTWSPGTDAGWWSPQNRKPSNPGVIADYEVGTLGFDQFSATLGEVQEALADATVVTIGVKQGTWNAGLVALVDSLRVDHTTFDFQGASQEERVATATATIGAALGQVQETAAGLGGQSPSPSSSPEVSPSQSSSPSPSPEGSATTPPSASPTPAEADPQAAVEEVAAQIEASAAPVFKALGDQPPGGGGTSTPSPTPTPAQTSSPTATPTTSSSPQPTQTPSQPSTGNNGGSSGAGSASASPSPTATSSSSSPSPTATASATPSETQQPSPEVCRTATIALDSDTIIATGSAGVTWTAAPGSTALLYAYSQPSTAYQVVRRVVTDSSGIARTQVRPATNTRLFALQDGCDQASFASDSVVLNVRTALSLFAARNGTQDYTFSGDSLPARPRGLIVSLYRVTADGRQVLTSQARASASSGDWTVRRQFTGTGRFGFVVRTGQDLQNAPGTSNVRSTLVF